MLNSSRFRQASQSRIIETLACFRNMSVREWLPDEEYTRTGRFLDSHGNSLRKFSDLLNFLRKEEILKVLASSGPCHCLDGWTYFSRSLSSLLIGDSHLARHLAYYAQLRAALSLLSCNGIGIFNGINFAANENGEIIHIGERREDRQGPGTHQAVWEALRLWSELPNFTDQFLEDINFHGKTLKSILDEVFPGSSGAPLVSKVIGEWGIDLEKFSQDHDARNISSYAPHAFNTVRSNLLDRWKLVHSIWTGLDPYSVGSDNLDQCLLRCFLGYISENLNDIYEYEENNMEATRTRIRDYYSTKFPRMDDEEDFPIIELARNEAGDVHAMICRALVLLRLATGVVHSSFLEAGFDPVKGDLQGLFDTFAIDRGLWTGNQEHEDLVDLWDDVSAALDWLQDCIEKGLDSQYNFIKFMSDQNYSGDLYLYLSQAERACIWGLGLKE